MIQSLNTENLPPPYCDLQEVLPFDPHGWYVNGEQLEYLIEISKAKTVVEIGCWLGQSTRHIASILPPDGKVYAVDHWLGPAEHQPGQWCESKSLPFLYPQFLSNVIHAGLCHKIIPIKMASLDAVCLPLFTNNEVEPDIIYIDAAHDTDSVYADLVAWSPYCKNTGIICGDDWDWASVRIAVEKFAKEKKCKLKLMESFGALRKITKMSTQEQSLLEDKHG